MKSSAQLVRERLEEKRYFEARFLLARIGEDLPRGERRQLEEGVASIIARADRLRFDARLFFERREYDRAAEKFAELEQLVADYPQLAEEKKRLAAAGTFSPRPRDEESPVTEAAADTSQEREEASHEPPVQQPQEQKQAQKQKKSKKLPRKRTLLAPLLLLVLGAVLYQLYWGTWFRLDEQDVFQSQAAAPVETPGLPPAQVPEPPPTALAQAPPEAAAPADTEPSFKEGVRVQPLMVVE